MLCFLRARKWRDTPGIGVAWKLGVACGLGLLTRSAFLPVIACFGVFLLCVGDLVPGKRFRAVSGFVLPSIIAVVLVLLVNWVKWGLPLDFGHHGPREGFSTNPVVGLSGLLISPGKGLLFYAPVMLLPVLFSRRIRAAGSPEFFLTVVVTAVYLGIYGHWYDWGGGLSWGPRFLIPLIAPWMALTGRVLANDSNPVARQLLIATAVPGALVQFLGVAVYPHWIWAHTPPKPFSLTEPNIVLTARAFIEHGVDDLWVVSTGASGHTVLLSAILVLGATALGLITIVSRPGIFKESAVR